MEGLDGIAEVRRDAPERLGEDERAALAELVLELDRHAGAWRRDRDDAAAARLQLWAGQTPDGKQRAAAIGAEPFPFEGSSDQRILWADALVRERVQLLCVAAGRAALTVAPDGTRGADEAWGATQVMRRLLDTREWRREVEKAATYISADTPAVCLLTARFERRRETELRRLDAAGLAELYAGLSAAGGMDADEAAREAAAFAAALADDATGEDELAEAVLARFDVGAARARRAVRQIRREGLAEFPVPGPVTEGLRFRALRFLDDFLIPDNTRDFDSCPVWAEWEWFDRAGLLARAAEEGWERAFAEAVLERDGEGILLHEGLRGGGAAAPERRGMYQVVTVHYAAVDEDGVPGRFRCALHAGVPELTAYGRRLEDDRAAVLVTGETCDQWALNARGIPTVVGPLTGVVKSSRDDMCDAGRLMALPPVTGDGYGTGREQDIDLSPLSYIPLKRGGELRFMGGIQYPAHLLQALKDIRADVDEYYARPDGGRPKELSDTAREFEVGRWLDALKGLVGEAWRMVARLGSEELLAGAGGRAAAEGAHRVTMVFDPTTLDEDRSIKKLNALAQVKAADAENEVDAGPLMRATVRALFPHYADEALRRSDEGGAAEDEAELRNYLSIRAGVMPRMNTGGTWNYRRRLEWYERALAANPAMLEDMAPGAREMLDGWLAALQQQARQFGENAGIGRTGDARVDPGHGGPGAREGGM